MTRKPGKRGEKRDAKAPGDARKKKSSTSKGTKGAKKATKAKKTPSQAAVPTPRARKVRAPDTTALDIGDGGLILAVLAKEHPDLIRELQAEARETGQSPAAVAIAALRDAYGLPERWEPSFVVHVCPRCAATWEETPPQVDDDGHDHDHDDGTGEAEDEDWDYVS